jgi:hypothetical protein
MNDDPRPPAWLGLLLLAVAAIVCLLVFTKSAKAQDVPWAKTISHIGDETYARREASYYRAEKQFVASCALDLGSTAYGISRGYREGSPLSFGGNKWGRVAGPVLADLLVYGVARWMRHEHEERAATVLLRFSSVVRVGAASLNVMRTK